MHRLSIGSVLVGAGVIAALTNAPPATPGLPVPVTVPDTTDVTAPWMKQVTLEPIRVVVPRETLYEAVTMETIRVVIPRAKTAMPEDREGSPRR
jgi:hypothetical protein